MQHLHSPDDSVAVLFAFSNHNDEHNDVTGILLLLIQQVTILQPQTPKAVERLYNCYLVEDRYPTFEDVTEVLRESLHAFREIYILIDGLDELANGLEPLLDLLFSLVTSFHNLKILVTSRVSPTLLIDYFTFFDGHISISGQDIITDLQLFIRRGLNSSHLKRIWPDGELQQRVEQRILQKANGSYV